MSAVVTKVLSFIRFVREGAYIPRNHVDPGGGALVDSDQANPPGDDSPPLPGDYGVAVHICKTQGTIVTVGYVDTVNEGQAEPGEKRLYSRDEEGAPIAVIWLKNDGTISVTNQAGSLEMQPSGTIIANGVEIDTSGNITTSGTIIGGQVQTSAGINLDTHTHGGVETGGGSTGPAQ